MHSLKKKKTPPDILEKTIPQMFEVMQTVTTFVCNYVKRGRFSG